VSVYIYIDKKNRQIYSFMANDLVSTKLSLSSSLTQTFLAYFSMLASMDVHIWIMQRTRNWLLVMVMLSFRGLSHLYLCVKWLI
jgi:hypothetical protein